MRLTGIESLTLELHCQNWLFFLYLALIAAQGRCSFLKWRFELGAASVKH